MKLENLIRMVIHKTDYGFIEYIPEVRCLRSVRIGFKLSREIQEDCNVILDFLIKSEPGSKMSLLYDLQEAEPILQEDLQWIAEVWKPQVVGLGVTHVAIVPPKNELGQINVDIIREVMKTSQVSTIDRSFPDNDSALEWLKQVAMCR